MTVPEPDTDVTGEAALFAAYLTYFRETVGEAVLGLTDEERRSSRLASGWTPIELLSHLAHMEQRWFVWGFLREQVGEPWGDWSASPPAEGARWQVPDDVTAESLVAMLRSVGERTSRVLASHDLDTRAEPHEHFDEGVPTLRWICFHVLHEYARHAGHLDIAVELAGTPIRQSSPRGEDPEDR
jgi:uncharacterized damage-inducible protein DinB